MFFHETAQLPILGWSPMPGRVIHFKKPDYENNDERITAMKTGHKWPVFTGRRKNSRKQKTALEADNFLSGFFGNIDEGNLIQYQAKGAREP